jgi:hypothetical protein
LGVIHERIRPTTRNRRFGIGIGHSIGATPEAQAIYLNELKARFSGRSPDDKKEATKLAVETAKMLITVGIAVLVAAGTMLQFARSGGLGWQSPTIICLVLR